jgi:hypothetical protein
MMRAALILVGVGSLFAMERGTPPRVAKAADQPPSQSTVGISDPRDTLKADRLEIPYFQNELPTQPISFELTPPAGSTPVISKEAGKIVSGNRHDAENKKTLRRQAKARSRILSQGPRPQIPNQGPRPCRQRPRPWIEVRREYASREAPVDVKPCRPNVFDNFSKH